MKSATGTPADLFERPCGRGLRQVRAYHSRLAELVDPAVSSYPAGVGCKRRPEYRSEVLGLNVPEQQQNNDDYEHEPNPAARIVPPAAAIAPPWKRADQQQDQDHKKDCP
jgi:hypothetical protein